MRMPIFVGLGTPRSTGVQISPGSMVKKRKGERGRRGEKKAEPNENSFLKSLL